MSNNDNIDYKENFMDNVSYSTYLEKERDTDIDESPLKHTLAKKPATWVNDGDVLYCQNTRCNAEFTYIRRKHHCRKCGKIFCYNCSNYQANIPNYMLSDDSKKGTMVDYLYSYISDSNLRKVCKKCFNEIEQLNSVKRITKVFTILNLDIKQLKKIGRICKVWMFAANYCLSLVKNVQYKLPYENYLVEEILALNTNAKFFAGHSRYLTYLFKILHDDDDIEWFKELLCAKKCVDCFSLMCSSNCNEKMSSADMIDVFGDYIKTGGTQKKLRLILDTIDCSDEEFKCYIPFLTYNIEDNNTIIDDYLIEKCSKNFFLLNSLYREINILSIMKNSNKYSRIKDRLIKYISKNKCENNLVKLLEGDSFINTIKDVSRSVAIDKDNNINYNLGNSVTLPINTDIVVDDIVVDEIVIKSSATKPVIIPCITDNNRKYSIMFKNENTRKDQIIMDIIRLIVHIVKKEEDLDLDVVTYNVLSTGFDNGIIEIVGECDTIYSIHEKLKLSILNYILEKNNHLSVGEVRDKFIRSTAAFSVITYILGVGDRHLDNIMVARDGRLFHIDFGYILGQETVINNPGIRITPDIIEAIGGENSENYIIFKELCTNIYNCIRRNINIFYHMLTLLPSISDINLTEEQIKNQIITRFRPGENRIAAELHLVNQLEHNSFTDKIKDWCHYHSKEKTVTSSVSKMSSFFSAILPY